MEAPNNDWLAVSTDGFAEQNAARPPEHLVKELVQNALDALPDSGGTITLETETNEPNPGLWIHCEDTGCGITDMENLRTVFWTSKQDSHKKRGRMGRGFKEMLCLCSHCEVTSQRLAAVFHKNTAGKRLFAIEQRDEDTTGTRISILMPWEPKTTQEEIEAYFQNFLPPENVTFLVNGKKIAPRKPKHTIIAQLTTEAFASGRWTKPNTKTTIELIPCEPNQGMIYEMGIPVCPVEWETPYHANIQQRVPMNPNRDAVMSGFPAKIHKACLPTLLEELDQETARASWVGEAAAHSPCETLQKTVLEKAFGGNLARSVPTFGKFDHDADAEEKTGATILDTRQLSGGFRELVKTHVPTSKDVAEKAHREKINLAAASGTPPEDAKSELVKKIGQPRVNNVCKFYQWLATEILARILPTPKTCRLHVADLKGDAIATWSEQFQTLTLALDHRATWEQPLQSDQLATIVHETAHELAFHHGMGFAKAMEKTAGAALAAIIENPGETQKWREVLEGHSPQTQKTKPGKKPLFTIPPRALAAA